MKVLSYLDCGCAVMEDGSRSMCPSCSAPPPISNLEFARVQKLNRMERALQWLLTYHPESPETGAELPKEAWAQDYQLAVEYAQAALAGVEKVELEPSRLEAMADARIDALKQNEEWCRRGHMLETELALYRDLIFGIQSALGTEEVAESLIEVASKAHRAEQQNAKWEQTFEKRADREHEMIDEAIDDFCDAVLAKLKALGVPETDNCDGDEDVSTIFAGWIHARILDSAAGRAAGAGGVGENAAQKEATDNDPSSPTLEETR